MFGSEVLEVGIGMALLFLFVSLIATAAQEAVESIVKTRAGDLEKGIRELLNDRGGTGLAKQFYQHPLIYSLFAGDYDPRKLGVPGRFNFLVNLEQRSASSGKSLFMNKEARQTLPSYVPKAQFALALIDIVAKGAATQPPTARVAAAVEPEPLTTPASPGQGKAAEAANSASEVRSEHTSPPTAESPRPPSGAITVLTKPPPAALDDVAKDTPATGECTSDTGPPTTVESLRRSASTIVDPRIRRVMLSAIDAGQGDLDRVRKHIEDWYDGTMDRVSGWYKRRSQNFLFLFGLMVAIILNIDAISIASQLYSNGPLRKTIVESADAYVAANPTGSAPGAAAPGERLKQLTVELDHIGYPIGWQRLTRGCDTNKKCWRIARGIVYAVPGWLMTALAVMLGAPFWFDVLNKFMVIRSTVKPKEKSLEEGSEDRKGESKSETVVKIDTGAKPVAGSGAVQDLYPGPESLASQIDNGSSAIAAAAAGATYTEHTWNNGSKGGII